ncbi:MAG: ribonuclease III [Bryobacteraceae bacterium]
MRAELEQLEQTIGHRFNDRELLRRALSHSSHVHERALAGLEPEADNEQLEFLGDSVLGFIISEVLVARFPTFAEGKLSKLRAHLVSSSNLYRIAVGLNLGDYLLLGRGEELTGGRQKKTVLANALEALIAALYLDAGFPPTRDFVRRVFVGEGAPEDPMEQALATPLTDFKSTLQELAQSRRLPTPVYHIVHEEGPHHEKVFTVEVRVGRDWFSRGQGPSKKSAAQNAAQSLIEIVSAEDTAGKLDSRR